MTAENAWEGRYQNGTTSWDRNGVNPLFHDWVVATLASDANILIPGCGHGHEVIELSRLGFHVTGIDIAPTPVARMQHELETEGLQASIIQIDMFTYVSKQPFDAIYEQTSLCAIQPKQRLAYEKKLYTWLKPGGSLYALFMQTGAEGGPPFHCDVNDMKALFPTSRWDWEKAESLQSPHPSGRFELGYRLTKC